MRFSFQRFNSLLVILACTFAVSGCWPGGDSPDDQIAEQTRSISLESHRQVGLPGVVNFTEKRLQKELFELRDEVFTTYAYYTDLEGNFHFLCESLGYGIPYSAQFTNPWRVLDHLEGQQNGPNNIITQPEPNGLFVPEGLSATWVMCSSPDGGIAPIYFEPELTVSPFPLPSVNGPDASRGAAASSVTVQR